jgi:glycosyltransferase involved in cell wall biosynthesis
VSAEVAYYCDCALGVPVEKMVIIPNGVDIETLSAVSAAESIKLRRELNIDPEDLVYLSVGSIHGAKAQIPLVNAMKAVARVNHRAKLVLAGAVVDSDYGERLKHEIARLNLESSVILVGSRTDIARFYGMADIFVLPSCWEGWSLALTEAVCAGLPVVSTDVGGARELVAAAGGYLVKPPFASIKDLNGATVGSVVQRKHPEHIAQLSQAMIDAAGDASRRSVPERLLRALDQRHAIDLHARVYHWLMQGGRPGAARAWCRQASHHNTQGDSPLVAADDQPAHPNAGQSGSTRFDHAESHEPTFGFPGRPSTHHLRRSSDDASAQAPIRSTQIPN